MVIAQPESSHFGLFRLSPIFEKKVVMSSTGQTIHQIRPKKIASIIIAGHQYDHTIRFTRLVLRSCFRNRASVEYAIKPVTIRTTNAIKEIYLIVNGKNLFESNLFNILFTIRCLYMDTNLAYILWKNTLRRVK